ncbi:hypothetical protein FC83_GL003288 [Agrilactobacillus composti DSM 18527 = JCM 14202]|uniref:HTH marR-type domain-containing protein n=1 Tax=Agrilactobacillus composti DSM 18527 = JCM 14202 TaxID=1423734 RepID=X0PR48_9LACO|nr:MarR family transcriptional regulator [Agrilactobacillus composti]KRM33205.1 hypothetical protein FC83_GL003288 [Agrilactobacillus composti DSM 18527 = JCM 14202]GAF40277.1 transcriptional regulator, MarR family [Agrilactobacillus composti DSM 18527 = JCM 14202]
MTSQTSPAYDLVQQIAILNNTVTTTINQRLKPYGLNASNYFYILKIAEHPLISQSQLNDLIQMNQSSVTRSVNNLIKAGLVTKTTSAKDKRTGQLALTATGQAMYQKVAQDINGLNRKLSRQVLQPKALHQMIQQLSQALKA